MDHRWLGHQQSVQCASYKLFPAGQGHQETSLVTDCVAPRTMPSQSNLAERTFIGIRFMQARNKDHVAALSAVRVASERAEAACCAAEQQHCGAPAADAGSLPAERLDNVMHQHTVDDHANAAAANEVREPQAESAQAADTAAVAAGLLATLDLSFEPSPSLSMQGSCYRLPGIASDAANTVGARSEPGASEASAEPEPAHADVQCVQARTLLQHRAFSAVLPHLRLHLERQVGLPAAADSDPAACSGAIRRLASASGPNADAAAAQAEVAALEQDQRDIWKVAAPRNVAGRAAQQQPGDNLAAASAWQHTSVRFLGTGSSEPSKYRGPTGILLQVCISLLTGATDSEVAGAASPVAALLVVTFMCDLNTQPVIAVLPSSRQIRRYRWASLVSRALAPFCWTAEKAPCLRCVARSARLQRKQPSQASPRYSSHTSTPTTASVCRQSCKRARTARGRSLRSCPLQCRRGYRRRTRT